MSALFCAKTWDGTMRSTNWRERCCAPAGRLPRGSLCCRAGSIELVQKAGMMGAAIIVGVSAPTALAVRNAASTGITLVGIARDDGFEVFTHPGRITQYW